MSIANGSLLLSLVCSVVAQAGELAGHTFLITSIRTGDTEVFLVDPYSGDATNLTRSPQAQERYPCWAPDGRHIGFTSDRDGTYNLFVMDADGANVRQLTHEKPPTVCYAPTWSQGGHRIAFGLHGDKALICTIAPDGTHFQTLGEGHDPCISPDGKSIAFTGAVDKGYCVFVMDADGGNVRQVTKHVNVMGSVFPTWSPDGARIAYTDQVGEALEIFVCDADGANVRQLTSLGKMSSPAAWSPDGKWISFRVCDTAFWRSTATSKAAHEEKRADFRPVYVMGADGSNPHIIEVLRYHCAIDGSRAVWKPHERPQPRRVRCCPSCLSFPSRPDRTAWLSARCASSAVATTATEGPAQMGFSETTCVSFSFYVLKWAIQGSRQ